MAYFVHFSERVDTYLADLEGLTTADRAEIIEGIATELGRDADKFLANNALGTESLHFRYDYVQPTNRTLYCFEFIVDGSRMEVGVVTVVYVECEIHRADELRE